MFEYTIKYLEGGIHGHPIEKQEEIKKAIGVFKNGKGYLTNEVPVKIVFFKDDKKALCGCGAEPLYYCEWCGTYLCEVHALKGGCRCLRGERSIIRVDKLKDKGIQ